MTNKDIKLSKLVSSDGFRINGIATGDNSGFSVSGAGDVNKDGIADLIIGAPNADFSGSDSGQSYVVFGRRTEFALDTNLSALDGSIGTGFRIGGITAGDYSGRSVSGAGDVNGDGFADVIIGSPGADPNGSDSGRSYVVFGRSGGFAPNIIASALDGSNGFRINGIAFGDVLGTSVSSGNVNGDGFSDLIIGAPGVNASRPNGLDAGQSYVVLGRGGGFAPVISPSDLNGSNGFRINGIAEKDLSGTAVSRGDVNGDKIADVIIGAPNVDFITSGGNRVDAGQSYVVFGRSSGASVDIDPLALNGSNGFRINGIAAGDLSGTSISSGDVNRDGFADVIIGAPNADPGGRVDAGQVYVLFGSNQGFNADINLSTINENIGFRIDGLAAGDNLGASVSSGDVNADRFADIIIGSPGADANGADSGRSYVVFGGRFVGAGGQVNLSTLANVNGIRRGLSIDGAQAGERSGSSVSTSNVNGDQCDDVIIGAPNSDTNGGADAGRSYVVFGNFAEVANLSGGNATVNATRVKLGAINANLNTGELIFNPDTPREVRRPIAGSTNILGTKFNDTLTGDSSVNTLSGNAGKDTLTGGGSKDRFVFNLPTRFNRTQIGIDTITDFTRGQDKILLDRSTFTGVKKISFASVKNLRAAGQSDAAFTYIRRSGALYFNANGRENGFGNGGQFADLTNGLNLNASDLQLGRA
jgi:Ca2+-binding RTX toxin-like protein